MMELKDMKEFAALTDEERAEAIKREECRLKAIEAYDEEWFKDHHGRLGCGCKEQYYTLDKEGQDSLNICFDSYGNIGSDLWEGVFVSNLRCLTCGQKPKAPQWYIDEVTEQLMGD
tara:strand:- start:1462 stop:1809 length:348 start_codon:yes stop_codon:yes gene_type:complete